MMATGSTWGVRVAFVALLVFFWASIIAAIGTLGLYLLRIYKEVRGRPRFIIQDKIGFEPGGPMSG
jgi:dolichol-phosphate mannosyltransferase